MSSLLGNFSMLWHLQCRHEENLRMAWGKCSCFLLVTIDLPFILSCVKHYPAAIIIFPAANLWCFAAAYANFLSLLWPQSRLVKFLVVTCSQTIEKLYSRFADNFQYIFIQSQKMQKKVSNTLELNQTLVYNCHFVHFIYFLLLRLSSIGYCPNRMNRNTKIGKNMHLDLLPR